MQTDGRVASSNIAAVVDPSGQLHAFYPHTPADSATASIDYLRWDDAGWSQSIDIIVDPDTDQPANIRAVLDSQGTVHLIWLGSNNALRYAKAPIANAGTARGWTDPQTIASAFGMADLVAGTDNTLYAVYSNAASAGRVALSQSTDGGRSWSSPTDIAATALDTVPNEVRLAVDGNNRLHVVWTEYNVSSDPSTGVIYNGVFYTRSSDGGVTWETPTEVDGPRHGQIGVATVGNDEVHLVWRSGVGGDGTFHQWSRDGGATWSSLGNTEDGGGISGLPSFALDSLGRLHYVIGPGMYAVWDGKQLSGFEDVVTDVVRTKTAGSEAERAEIAITDGNQVHVIFEYGFHELLHTTRLVDAPRSQTTPSPTATGISNSVVSTSPTMEIPQTTLVPSSISPGVSQQLSDSTSAFPMLCGMVSASLVVLSVVLVTVRRKVRK